MHPFLVGLFTLPIIGFFVGILSMLYGIGGGVIITPVIYIFLRHLNFDSSVAMHLAIGTSLLNVLGSTLIASYTHHRQNNILWGTIKQLATFVIIGAMLGILLAHTLSGSTLKALFIIFLGIVVLNSLLNRKFRHPWKLSDYTPPSYLSTLFCGILTGSISVLAGIGGGTIIVPYLRHYKMPLVNATAAATTISPLLAAVGSVGYLSIHLNGTPPLTLGAINFPIFFCIFLGSWLGVHLGKRISLRFSETSRAKSFPILIACIIGLMLSM